MATHYQLLGVNKTASAEQIRSAHRVLVKTSHPDRGGSSDRFLAIQEAYEVLSDPERRLAYDNRGSTDLEVYTPPAAPVDANQPQKGFSLVGTDSDGEEQRSSMVMLIAVTIITWFLYRSTGVFEHFIEPRWWNQPGLKFVGSGHWYGTPLRWTLLGLLLVALRNYLRFMRVLPWLPWGARIIGGVVIAALLAVGDGWINLIT